MTSKGVSLGLALSLCLCAGLQAYAGENLLRNGSFELGPDFNGAPSKLGSEHIRNYLVEQGKCARLPVEAWMIEGPSAEGASLRSQEAKFGASALRLAPPSGKSLVLISTPEAKVEPGPLALSVWLDAEPSAKAVLEIEFTGLYERSKGLPRTLSKKSVELPKGSKGWTRLELRATAPNDAFAFARLKVEGGAVSVDGAQLEQAAEASTFNVRKEEALRLSFEGVEPSTLPFWVERKGEESWLGSVFGSGTKKELLVENGSLAKVEGDLELWLGPWNAPKTLRFAKDESFSLEPGEKAKFSFETAGLAPDAYLAHAVLKRKGSSEIDGANDVDVSTKIGGVHSNHMLKARDAIRFAIVPAFDPKKIFGVGNGMLGYGWKGLDGGWSSGWPLSLFATARGEGFVCGRERCSTQDQAYLFAAAGIPFHRMESQKPEEGAPKGSSFIVPGTKSSADVWSEEGMAFVLAKAAETGKANAANPCVASCQMANEQFFPYRDGLCPTKSADESFREWCRREHGSLDVLNKRWGSSLKSWDEVEQPASAKYAEEVMNRPKKEGAANIDWTASLGNITPEIHKRMLAVPGRGMDWLRWRSASSLRLYKAFSEEAKRFDSKTLYGTNLCWPDFWPQMFIPFLRQSDLAMLDVQYASGMQRALGKSSEMIEILEMAESCAEGKPVWGIEIYVQPQWDPEFAALQNWGMLAHGMSNNLVFAWGPYSDHGIPKETRAWERKDAVPMWMLIDLDGERLPAYYANKRSLEEIKEFHARYDALSLSRPRAETAFYVSNDNAEFSSLESANKPWDSPWTRTRNNLCYLLRLEGVRLDFVDDATLPSKPGRFSKLVVPASYALSQEAASKIAGFAKAGGTVVLAGPCGATGKWLERNAVFGGDAWAELDWSASGFKLDAVEAVFDAAHPSSKEFKGFSSGKPKGAVEILDAKGKAAGWKRQWGEGSLVAYSIMPDFYSEDPHPSANLKAWAKQLASEGGLPRNGSWICDALQPQGPSRHGEGAPVVEVVVRERVGSAGAEKFVFLLNQGGEGSGALALPSDGGAWKAEDAVGGESLGTLQASNGGIELKLKLKAWGSRAIRLVKI